MLIEIAPPAFDVAVDLRYATDDNLTGRPVYRRAVCLLHPEAAARLTRAAELARGAGFRLRVYDAFRPVEAQWELWHALPDPVYIADPRLGSNHSRGVAVDLTLDGADGRSLDMGTPFDDMTERSHHGRADLPPAVQRNRALLLGIMTAAGWRHYDAEWWHYQLPDAERHPLLTDAAAGGRMMAGPVPGRVPAVA
ncbi:D-alanyl-D-alanine dipeptidase [Azospirillum sp.]|uniref:D-alanyl-D-alanine dipeptidase n=1 Tax=Azospirillum sp. TaxID=34012 RepID=UPI002D41B315|nr:D-alanyl-D-alanine dipeptidase [Azospirillum sp.]HYD63905.1 D-alanyl-D-alanine dipeptidase [Azospirillum sp.]